MQRNGVRISCLLGAVALLCWIMPVAAGESADEIMTMLSWWDEYGSYWDEAKDLMDFATEEPQFTLAENTVETSE